MQPSDFSLKQLQELLENVSVVFQWLQLIKIITVAFEKPHNMLTFPVPLKSNRIVPWWQCKM